MAIFKNRHKGELGIVIANGPSLKETPLEFLYDYPTFGSNYISLLEDFIPTYLTVIDPEAIGHLDEEKQIIVPDEERMSLITPNVSMVENFFVIHTGQELFKAYQNVRPIYNVKAACWSHSPIRFLFTGGTATYTNLQLAFYMGFDAVVIVGLDHDYSGGHFNKDYTQSQKVENEARQKTTLAVMERSYWMARKVFEEHERSLANCSVYSNCKVFLRIRPPWQLTGEYDSEDTTLTETLRLPQHERLQSA